MVDMSVEQIETEIKKLQENIRILEQERDGAAELLIKREHSCCPDVCSLIDKIIEKDEEDIRNFNLAEKRMTERLQFLGIKKTKALEPIKKDVNSMRERIMELERLKSLLKYNNICVCEQKTIL